MVVTELREPTVCAPDADKILLSSDGVLFQVHHRNLAAHSDAFFDIVAASPKKAGVHVLTEVSQTLELLFQFVYPQRQPDAGALLGHELMMLAEAAEKYRIYSAMQVCKAAMKWAPFDFVLETETSIADQHHCRGLLISMPIEVLTYALRHGHRDLCEDVAPFTLDQDAAFMVKRLERDVFIRWVSKTAIPCPFGNHADASSSGVFSRTRTANPFQVSRSASRA